MSSLNEKDQITLVNEDGEEELFNVLFTFTSDKNGKSYILIYPASDEDKEEVDIQAYAFNPDDNNLEGELVPIENNDEWEMVEEVLNTFLDDPSLNN